MNFSRLLKSFLFRNTPASRRYQRARYIPESAEKLEYRTMLSGNVLVQLNRGNLRIIGDRADNNVLIIAENGNIIARGIDGTTINGTQGDVLLQTGSTTIGRNLFATMRGGNDTLTFSGITIGRNAFIAGGTGNDSIGLNDVTVGRYLSVYGYSGDDGIWLNDVTVGKSSWINSGFGNDTIFVDGVQAGKSMNVIARRGNNNVRVVGTNTGDDLRIYAGNRNDNIDVRDSVVNDDLVIATYGGDDAVQVTSTQIGDDALLFQGGGNDTALIGGTTTIADDLRLFGGGRTDTVEVQNDVTVGDKNRRYGVEGSTADAAVFAERFDAATTGLFAVTDALNQVFSEIIEPAALALTLDTSNSGAVQSNGTLLTNNAEFQIDGTTTGGATVEVDADGDGQFDDGTVIADANGFFSVTPTLQRTDANNGSNQVNIRVTDRLNRTIQQQLDVHLAVGTVSRFVTSQGTFDVELLDADAPITVANFLNYDQRYDNSIIHRSALSQTNGDFIVQGGGFRLNPNLERVPTDAAIQNEFNAANSNLRGTLSVALGASPDSGTSQWFFNTADNTFLDSALHTVFGFVIGSGMDIVDQIQDLATFDLSTVLDDGALGELPLDGYTALAEELTGTIETVIGDTTVQGTGTAFTTELIVGQRIKIVDDIFTVNSIVSDTELTLNVAPAQAVMDQVATIDAVPTDAQFVTITDIDSALFG